MRITIEIGEPDGRTEGDGGTASASPAVVINIDATAAAELLSSPPAAEALSAGGAPTHPYTPGGRAQAGGPTPTGSVFNAGPAPLLKEAEDPRG